MIDLSTCVPTEHDVQHVLTALEAWYGRYHALRDLDSEEKKEQDARALWHRVPSRLVTLEDEYGIEEVERWWQKEGKELCWDKEKNCPQPVLAHLLLHASTSSARERLMLWALDQGWSPDVFNSIGDHKAPLHYWVRAPLSSIYFENNKDLYHSIFDRLVTPSTVNFTTTQGRTALSLLVAKHAVCTDDEPHILALFEKLLRSGADIHLAEAEGWTPLHFALAGTSQVSSDLVVCLLKHGADPFRPNDAGDTAFSLCDVMGQRWTKKSKDAIKETLRAAGRERDAEMLTRALEEGAQQEEDASPDAGGVLKKRARL